MSDVDPDFPASSVEACSAFAAFVLAALAYSASTSLNQGMPPADKFE